MMGKQPRIGNWQKWWRTELIHLLISLRGLLGPSITDTQRRRKRRISCQNLCEKNDICIIFNLSHITFLFLTVRMFKPVYRIYIYIYKVTWLIIEYNVYTVHENIYWYNVLVEQWSEKEVMRTSNLICLYVVRFIFHSWVVFFSFIVDLIFLQLISCKQSTKPKNIFLPHIKIRSNRLMWIDEKYKNTRSFVELDNMNVYVCMCICMWGDGWTRGGGECLGAHFFPIAIRQQHWS